MPGGGDSEHGPGELQCWQACEQAGRQQNETCMLAYRTESTVLPTFLLRYPAYLQTWRYLPASCLPGSTACCVDGKITFADQVQVVGEGHSRLHEKGSDDMDRPCRSGLSDGSDLRSGMGQGGTGAPLQHQIHCPPRQGRNISVNCGPPLAPGSRALGYLGTWYLPGDLLYRYLF